MSPGVSKADALREAFTALGRRDVPAARAWLAERGVTVDRRYAYTVTWHPEQVDTGQQARPGLRVLSGGES